MPKGTSQAEATLNDEKIKSVALTIVELCWSEGKVVSLAVSKSVSRNSIIKFQSNF